VVVRVVVGSALLAVALSLPKSLSHAWPIRVSPAVKGHEAVRHGVAPVDVLS
jgi:hypothetical protein